MEVRVVSSVAVASVRALDVVAPPSPAAPPASSACLAVRVTHAGPAGDAVPLTVWLAAAADPANASAWGAAQAARSDHGALLPPRGAVTVAGVVPPLVGVSVGDADAAAVAAAGALALYWRRGDGDTAETGVLPLPRRAVAAALAAAPAAAAALTAHPTRASVGLEGGGASLEALPAGGSARGARGVGRARARVGGPPLPASLRVAGVATTATTLSIDVARVDVDGAAGDVDGGGGLVVAGVVCGARVRAGGATPLTLAPLRAGLYRVAPVAEEGGVSCWPLFVLVE